MNSEALSRKIMGMPEFLELGGPSKLLSFPLLKRVKTLDVVVFFVYIYSDCVPTDYVICDIYGDEAHYLEHDEGILFLDIYDEISPEKTINSAVSVFAPLLGEDSPLLKDAPPLEEDDLPTAFDTGKSLKDLPEDMYARFDAIINDGEIRWDDYREYVKELISCTDHRGKPYLKAFL